MNSEAYELACDAWLAKPTVETLIAVLQQLPLGAEVLVANSPVSKLVLLSPPYYDIASDVVWLDVQ